MGRGRNTSPETLHGAGLCLELVRSLDWERTPLGPRASWSARLLATTNLLLECPHPMLLFWGPEHIQLYNDALIPSLGPCRHPTVMGQRGRDCWPEAWPTLGRLLEDARRGTTAWREDHLIPILRAGRLEEAFWTYSCSPVFEHDGAIGGVLLVCNETTSRVVADRRAQTLRALTPRLADATGASELTPIVLEVLRDATLDVPFVASFSMEVDGALRACERSSTGLGDLREPVPCESQGLDDDALATVRAAASTVAWQSGDAPELVALPPIFVQNGAWPEPVTRALVAKLRSCPRAAELLVFGLSPRRPFDAFYKEFVEHIARAVAQVRARLEANASALLARQTLERCSVEREKLLDAAEAAGRAKDEFLAMLGHELRNPLAPIMTAVHIMKMKDPGAFVREREIIGRQAAHLVKLVDDLLDVARVARGKITLQRVRVAVAEVIARAVETASPLFEQKRHVLRVEVPSDGLDVEADPLRLGQVFANLLTNAAKYTDPGGQIAASAHREGDCVVVRISDNGMGVPPDQLPHLFDAFFQGRRSVDRGDRGPCGATSGERVPGDSQGLGLGLAIVKSFVTLHGGEVSATSREGGGSTFEVRLPAMPPRAEPEVEPHVASTRHATATAVNGRVLLVDDSDDILEVVSSLLRHEGYEVLTMRDAPSALRAAPVFCPHVAVLDIGLPAMDGYELAAHLREALGERVPKLIAMTGYGQEADRERARRAGFVAHLVKPVDPTELLAAVRT